MHNAIIDNEAAAGYRAPQVCKLVGITYRQLDHWARTGLLMPSLRKARGSGTQRLYSFTDLLRLRVVKRLLDAGLSLRKIRKAVEWMRDEMGAAQPLVDFTLVSDGTDIWVKDQEDEAAELFLDLLKRGQGVFGIAIGQVQRDLEGEILEMFPPAAAARRAEQEPRAEAAAT